MSRSARRALSDLLGTPAVPPGRMTAWATRMRARISGAHRSSAPPPAAILESMLAIYDNRVMALLVERGVPNHLDRPMHAEEIAAACVADPDGLDRLLRYAAARGIVKRDRHGRYRPTAVTHALRPGESSWAAWVEFLGAEWFWDACRNLDASVSPAPLPAFEASTGQRFFEYVLETDPSVGRSFNAAMEAGATMQALALVNALDWDRIVSVCDVGGGTGAAARTLLSHLPGLQATVFDLPTVTATIDRSRADINDRLHTASGSFFERIPSGHDRYLLLAIIHDWNDEEAVEILSNLRAAMSEDSSAFIVETTIRDRPLDPFATASDLLMMTLATGRERTEAEHRHLFGRSGLGLETTRVLPTGFVAYELTVPREGSTAR